MLCFFFLEKSISVDNCIRFHEKNVSRFLEGKKCIPK